MHGTILKRDLRFWKRCCRRVKSFLDVTPCGFVNTYYSPDFLNYLEDGDSELPEKYIYIDYI